MKNFYIPEGIAGDYKFIVPSADYVDIYNTNYLQPNQTYTYYRLYNNLDNDLYQTRQTTTTQYNYGALNSIEIQPTNSYIYRKDYPQICFIVLIYVLAFCVLFNVFTSIVRKGGLLSGLL